MKSDMRSQVRQTFGGAYFHEKERNKEQKILAKI